jgi:hypothetical protein
MMEPFPHFPCFNSKIPASKMLAAFLGTSSKSLHHPIIKSPHHQIPNYPIN